MAVKSLSLGSSATTTQAINVTAATNATPIVITLTAGHGLKDGDKLAFAGVTGLTAMNSEYVLSNVGATTATLVNSAGNGTFGGTVRVGVVCDSSPHMMGQAATLHTFGNHVGVVDIEAYNTYADFSAGINSNTTLWGAPVLSPSGVTNSVGSVATPAKSTLTTAATNAGFCAQIKLPRILRVVPTTATSGTFAAVVEA